MKLASFLRSLLLQRRVKYCCTVEEEHVINKIIKIGETKTILSKEYIICASLSLT